MDEISYSGEKSRKTRRLSKRGIVFITFSVVILALVGGLLFFVSGKSDNIKDSSTANSIEIKTPTPTISPTATPTPKESPTPTVAAKKNTLKISIQNGSGEVGVAGDAATVLKNAGYSVVSTGNADNFDYKGITIQIKKTKKTFLSGLIDDLSSKYTVSESDATSDLSEDETFDVLVIIGK